ncbi:YcaO-like family protein [Amycolatopsis carbonis]|uniref:YcaO-like family protein n=1 Tax=Amycolatopsis carbonis TaxID=715471 RepID=A0A9Y2IED7_9PSEU|nr:YcaO-like family protein [Amycolatopsis sp. 2-15]WIX76983.1 YcaO-like family protein [Amycolatopsis sp. 2-15]
MDTSDPPRIAWTSGTWRSRHPEQTWSALEPVAEAAGVTRVADVTGLDDIGVPVHMAVRPHARALSVSQGKGTTGILSKISAVMEAIELYYAENLADADIAGTPATELGSLLSYPVEALDLHPGGLWHRRYPLDWLVCSSMITGRSAALPRELVDLDRTVVSDSWCPPLFLSTSNGLASGNSDEEAMLHALCEVAERDSIAAAGDVLGRHLFDPAEVADPAVDALCERIAAASARLRVFDLTGPMGLPCVGASVGGGSLPLVFGGFGCHPSTAVATCRAITEAVQQRLTVIAGTRDDLPDEVYDLLHLGFVRETTPARDEIEYVSPPADLPVAGLGQAMTCVAEKIHKFTGYEPLCLRLTESGAPVSVVKVVAPGLRLAGHGNYTAAGG